MRTLQYRQIAGDLPFHIATYRSELAEPGEPDWHDHDFAEIMVVTHGQGWHETPTGRQRLESGDGLALWPTHTHRFGPESGSSLRFVNVAFPLTQWVAALAFLELPAVASAEPLSFPGQRVLPQIRALRGTPGPRRTQAMLAPLLFAVLDRIPADDPGLTEPIWWAELVARVVGSPVVPTAREVAAMAPVSAGHLSRIWVRFTGVSLSDYLDSLRLQRVAERLRRSDAPVEAIADATGFSSAAYLHRRFVARYGCTPGRYRRRPVDPIFGPPDRH